MGMRKFKRGLKGNQAIDLLLEMEREKAFGNGGIMCKCEECGGLGYAKDETLLDSNGYLKDANCLCGGRIKRVDKKSQYKQVVNVEVVDGRWYR